MIIYNNIDRCQHHHHRRHTWIWTWHILCPEQFTINHSTLLLLQLIVWHHLQFNIVVCAYSWTWCQNYSKDERMKIYKLPNKRQAVGVRRRFMLSHKCWHQFGFDYLPIIVDDVVVICTNNNVSFASFELNCDFSCVWQMLYNWVLMLN